MRAKHMENLSFFFGLLDRRIDKHSNRQGHWHETPWFETCHGPCVRMWPERIGWTNVSWQTGCFFDFCTLETLSMPRWKGHAFIGHAWKYGCSILIVYSCTLVKDAFRTLYTFASTHTHRRTYNSHYELCHTNLPFHVSTSLQDFTGRAPSFLQVTNAFNKSFRNWHPFGQLQIAWEPRAMGQQISSSFCYLTSWTSSSCFHCFHCFHFFHFFHFFRFFHSHFCLNSFRAVPRGKCSQADGAWMRWGQEEEERRKDEVHRRKRRCTSVLSTQQISAVHSSLALHVHAIPWWRENVEFLQKQMEETPGGKMREDVVRNM